MVLIAISHRLAVLQNNSIRRIFQLFPNHGADSIMLAARFHE